ncbi:MAG TPA: diacylglycerol kinase family protein [Terriglobales bacterium]|nr:diacylglycerol kinase family protein [Terriglobales bacterium]
MTRRAVFLLNPASGHGRLARQDIVGRSAEAWKHAGWETELVPIAGPGTATEQTCEIVSRGCDVLFACGGDGTVHEILQGLVTTRAETAMGIVPLGTGNVVANNLGLPHATAQAAAMQLKFFPRRIGVGKMTTTLASGAIASRYFLAAGGFGLHAKMIFEAHARLKKRSGMMAYYRSGFRLMFFEPRTPFEIDLTHVDGTRQTERVYELLAIKVAMFSGIVRRWRPGASLADPVLRMLIVKTPSRVQMISGSLRCMAGGCPQISGVEIVPAVRAVCRPIGSTDARLIHSEADGESLGILPGEVSSVPDAFALLMPPQ